MSRGRNRNSLEAKGAALGLAAAAATLGVTFGVAALMRGVAGASISSERLQVTAPLPAAGTGALDAQLVRGRALFTQECVACHGNHAQGGMGPDLRRSEMSEAQMAVIIKAGMKPEMPPFGNKLKPPEVKALVLYIRSLNN